MTSDDLPFLTRMWHQAAFWDPDRFVLPVAEARAIPELAAYIDGWGRPGDTGLLVEDDEPLGAAWFRSFTAEAPGYGFIDAAIPELAIAVEPAARGRGVGTALLTALIDRAVSDGAPGLSLSVSGGNPSRRLYERAGFVEVVVDEGGSATMVLRFAPP